MARKWIKHHPKSSKYKKKIYWQRHKILPIRLRPKAVGTAWISSAEKVHGPRIEKPDKFKNLYTENQDWIEKRKHHITNYNIFKHAKLPNSSKLKVGTLKKTGQLAIQSVITPVKDWKRLSLPPYKRKGSIGRLI